ncbi:MAG: DUF881 domain-containing protein [Nocardioides sp.]
MPKLPIPEAAKRVQRPFELLRGAITRPTRRQLVVAAALALLGFGAVTQVHSNDVTRDYAGYRQQDLIDVLQGLSAASERSRREIDRLERTKQQLQSDRTAREAALTQAQQRGDQLAILAGQVPVEGPGVRITIDGLEAQLPLDLLLDLVQELRTAGAEAIEFNDSVRVVAQTSFELGGAGIYIDGEAIKQPYVIEVIGDPRTLAEGVQFSRGPQERTEDLGGDFTVDQRDAVTVESVSVLTGP